MTQVMVYGQRSKGEVILVFVHENKMRWQRMTGKEVKYLSILRWGSDSLSPGSIWSFINNRSRDQGIIRSWEGT